MIHQRQDRNPYASRLILLLSLTGLAGTLALPSGLECTFDGLPWSGSAEVLVLIGILPFLLLTGWRFLRKPYTALGLLLLCGFKIGLALGAPSSGWSIRVYENPEDRANGRLAATYQELWTPGISAAWDRPFTDQRDFPLEWINSYNDEARRARARPVLEVSGTARLPRDGGLALVVGQGCRAEFWAWTASGQTKPIPIAADLQQAHSVNSAALPRGNLEIRGLLYGDPARADWSLIPVIVDPKNQVESAFGKKILWRDRSGSAAGDDTLTFYTRLTLLVVVGLSLFLGSWTLWIFRQWRAAGFTPLTQAALIGLSAVAPILLQTWKIWFPYSLKLQVGLLILLLCGLDRIWTRKALAAGPQLGLILLLAVGPSIISHFLLAWSGEAGRMTFFSLGDDWLTYQRLAREIVLGGDPWQKGDPIFHVQPLYRWLVALGHIFFGQSPLALRLLDVWSVVAAACLLAAIAWRFGAAPPVALLTSLVYLKLTFNPDFSRLIGSGLQEYAAMFLLLLAAWAVVMARNGNWRIMLGAGFLAVLGFWLRMDHLGCLAGLGLLVLEPVEGGPRQAWRQWLGCWKRLWRPLAIYWIPLILAVVAVLFRNWLFSGRLTLHDPGYLKWLTRSLEETLGGLRILLSAKEQGLSQAGWFIWGGTVTGILALFFRPGPLRYYPLGLGIILAATLAPYFYALVNGYTPRFSIHLLPLALLSACLIVQYLWNWAKTLGKPRGWR